MPFSIIEPYDNPNEGRVKINNNFALLNTDTVPTYISGGTNITIVSAVTSSSAYTYGISLNDNVITTSVSATTLNGDTILSGSTDLYSIFLTTNDGNDITRVQPGTNTTTGGTANSPTINLINTPYVSGLSATTLSGGTIFSGVTDLSVTIGTKIDKLITFILTGSTYVLGTTDNTKLISITASTATTVMIPNNTAVTISNGTQILFEQNGTGQITFSGNAGVTLTSSGSKTKTFTQYSTASLIKKATNIWLLSGDITT